MSFTVLVTNQPPTGDDNVPQSLLDLFHRYTSVTSGRVFSPYQHQAQAFRTLDKDGEVFLVAGTAAGKTLAVAVPLFAKLQAGRIRKILLMYPTIALMEDQRRVMEGLAEITGLRIGQLQGGMSRSKLITALNHPVILATPDEVYWFFRKNVKYSGLLIYGLALVDEFVLDEAHLFNGLMLRNFEHLWQRIKTLTDSLGRSPKLHILTATPTEALKRLNQAEPVLGKSKCQDVSVEFRPSGRFDRGDQMVAAVSSALTAGQKKVLVVCNSARMAHQLFEQYKAANTSIIPVEHRLRFGRVKLGDLLTWLGKMDAADELIEQLNTHFFREDGVVLADIPDDTTVTVPLQDMTAHIAEILEQQCWRVKCVLWEQSQRPGETWESLLKNSPLPCRIIAAVRKHLENASEVERRQTIVDEWLTDTVERLSNIADDPIRCKAPAFTALVEACTSAGLDERLALSLVKRLAFMMKADPTKLPLRRLSDRLVNLRWLDWAVDKDKVKEVYALIRIGLESGELEAEYRHVGLWRKTDVPVIVYSGSMAKQAREGLLNVFADLHRAVLISTSAVEVGVDFQADTLITEECEGNGFLQRFGRVGRHGQGSQVVVLVSGDTYAGLGNFEGATISREDFSSSILAVFPRRNYAPGSQVLNASHYLVNEQLGRIGEKLNARPDMEQAKPIAEQLRTTDIRLGYGLRSTMPQIALRDGVSKDPFYLLRYVDNEDLRPADSPFDVARARTWFTSLIFQPARFGVTVDLDETLKASQHLFMLSRGQVRVYARPGIGGYHLYNLQRQFSWSQRQALYFVLLHGDVYLSRIELGLEMPTPEAVTDAEGNPLFIPNQTYLVLWGWTDNQMTQELLHNAGVADWEELIYDWERFKQSGNPYGMVILEKTTGACFAAYKELLDYVGRQIPS